MTNKAVWHVTIRRAFRDDYELAEIKPIPKRKPRIGEYVSVIAGREIVQAIIGSFRLNEALGCYMVTTHELNNGDVPGWTDDPEVYVV